MPRVEFTLEELQDLDTIVTELVGPETAREYPRWGKLRDKLARLTEEAVQLDRLAAMDTGGTQL